MVTVARFLIMFCSILGGEERWQEQIKRGIGLFCKHAKGISLWEGERVKIGRVYVYVNSYEIPVKNQFV